VSDRGKKKVHERARLEIGRNIGYLEKGGENASALEEKKKKEKRMMDCSRFV